MQIQQQILFFRNRIDFSLRQFIRWSRGGLKLEKVLKNRIFEEKNANKLEARLLKNYDLEDIVKRGSIKNYRINLYYLEMLEKTLDQIEFNFSDELRVADIGCSSWFYVRALMAFLERYHSPHPRSVQLYGYEADPFHPYFNFYSRFDYAKAYSMNLPRAHFVPEAFKPQGIAFDMITQFFPFIYIKDHLEWGLPGELFSPEKLLLDAWRNLKIGGLYLIVNQGDQEYQKQKEMLTNIGAQIKVSFCIQSPLYRYENEHYIMAAVKNE